MKKILDRILPPAIIAVLMAAVMSVTAFAELVPAKDGWTVSFTSAKKMVSNFQTSQMDDVIKGLQPGDYTDIAVTIKNENENTTDWYMTNEVLKSLEDTRPSDKGLAGGVYTYVLTYKGNKSGATERVLYSSDTVGGQNVSKAGEGLHEATSALKDWFYLDTLKQGEGGTVNLRVGFEGETQGNDYQDTLAELEMKFAVELKTNEEEEEEKKKTTDDDDDDDDDKKKSTSSSDKSSSSTTKTTVVRTGDYSDSVPYLIAAAVSGLVLLFLAFYSLRERRRQRGGKA